ncbi:unnamed protein product, partial [marine sediment metagenome]
VVKPATTWFNQLVKNWLDQKVAGDDATIYVMGSVTPGPNQLEVNCSAGGTIPDTVMWHYGTSKTNMPGQEEAQNVAVKFPATIGGLVTGKKYYLQVRATAPDGVIGTRSGIYIGVPE